VDGVKQDMKDAHLRNKWSRKTKTAAGYNPGLSGKTGICSDVCFTMYRTVSLKMHELKTQDLKMTYQTAQQNRWISTFHSKDGAMTFLYCELVMLQCVLGLRFGLGLGLVLALGLVLHDKTRVLKMHDKTPV